MNLSLPQDEAPTVAPPQPVCQRQREGRTSYRPAGEPIDTSRYGVEVISEREARVFVEQHHYSHTFPACRFAVGLFEQRSSWFAPELVGVAVFSIGVQPGSFSRYGLLPDGISAKDAARRGVELGRFVLLDDVRANGETWFLARARALLREEKPEVEVVLSYSDPVPRRSRAGEVVMPGHVGTIYQASNADYHGRGTSRLLWMAPDGSVINGRALSKIRNDEKGAAYAAEALRLLGAPRQRMGEDGRAWLERVLKSGCFTRFKHGGNHAYSWRMGGKGRGKRPEDAPAFPKQRDPEPAGWTDGVGEEDGDALRVTTMEVTP